MKVIYCPPGHDPTELARMASNRRMGNVLDGNLWIVAAVVVFLLVGFTVGPFKGVFQKPETAQTAQQAAQPQPVAAAPVVTPTPPVFCNLPMGGMIMGGDTAWVDLQDKVNLYRCDSGQLVVLESAQKAVQTTP